METRRAFVPRPGGHAPGAAAVAAVDSLAVPMGKVGGPVEVVASVRRASGACARDGRSVRGGSGDEPSVWLRGGFGARFPCNEAENPSG